MTTGAAPSRRFGKVIQAHFREIEYQSGAFGVWQNVLAGNGNDGTFLRDPAVDTGVGMQDLVLPQVETACDIQ